MTLSLRHQISFPIYALSFASLVATVMSLPDHPLPSALLGCLVICAGWMGIRSLRNLYRHIEAVSQQLSHFASGNLSTRLELPRQGSDLIRMSQSTNGIGISQSSVLAEIRATSEMLDRNSRIFLATCESAGEQSDAMRSATNTIAAALEEISASIGTIASQSSQIDGTARTIADTSRRLHQATEATTASFHSQSASIDSTSRDLSAARDRIGQLQESSQAITGFASEILDLVSKTRLLALNATIEAARAGEAGKSFAVVAGEVKELSALTSQMAEGIQKRIGEIEERTRSVATSLRTASQSMEELRTDADRSIRSAVEQSRLVAETDLALQEILKGSSDVSRALAEAQAGIGEIEKNAIETDSRAVRLHRGVGRIRIHAEDLGRAGKTLDGSIAHLAGPEPFFPWTQSLSLGIEIIDEQHKVLVRLLNHLHDLVSSKGPSTAVGMVLNQLAAYTHFHFEAEERYMESLGYPDLPAHQEIHRTFLAEIDGLVETHRRGQAVDGKALLERLRHWLTGHIMGTDRKYAALAVAKTSEH